MIKNKNIALDAAIDIQKILGGGLITGGEVHWVGTSGTAAYAYMQSRVQSSMLHTSIDTAIGQCTADRGDYIIVLPGHTETLTGASAIDLDIAGITIMGLGTGKLRPTLLLDAAAAVDIEVAADDITISNIIFKAGHSDVAVCFEIGAAKQFTIENCDILDNTTNENFLIAFRTSSTANAADGLTIRNCTYITADTSSTYFIHVQADIDRLTIENCFINMAVNTNDLAPILFATGKDGTNVKIIGNHVSRLNNDGSNDLFIDNDTTANTGLVAYNTMLHAVTTGESFIDMDGVALVENYATGVVTASGYVLPGIDS